MLELGRVHIGDIRELAPLIATNSVNCIVCSPPYMGLRDYGTARWEGGDTGCDHAKPSRQGIATLGPAGTQHHPCPAKGDAPKDYYRDRCGKCGAVRVDRQLGLEPTVGEFVANLVAVFRALRPALRDDGCMFINLGDSYSHDAKWGGATGGKHAAGLHGEDGPGRGRTASGLPPKCLSLAPARFAIAMVDDGWVLRSDIIWAKPNPMPESVQDRPTSAYEHVFLFVKQGHYWYDGDAIREPSQPVPLSAVNKPDWQPREKDGLARESFRMDHREYHPLGRNARNVWTISPAQFPGSHSATFPPELARRCVRAGCPPRVCARCGAPWVREMRSDNPSKWANVGGVDRSGGAAKTGNPQTSAGLHRNGGTLVNTRQALGWRPTCACGPDAGTRPGVVLDPFVGSGTTVAVAAAEGRRWIACDLDGRAVGWLAERLAKTQIRLPLWQAGEAAGEVRENPHKD